MRKKQYIPLSAPYITKSETSSVCQVLKTPCLSFGPKLEQFEKVIARFTGVRYAVAVNSGTSALHLAVCALGIGKGDEVITSPFSFIASSNCILFERAHPVFVDINPDTLNIDVTKIERKITKRTKAILAPDIFGHPADWDALRQIAKKRKLLLIEDSAEALGAVYKRKKAGSLAEVGIFAFYPNKQITTGEGGVLVTNSKRIAQACRSMRNQGRHNQNHRLLFSRLGYNYRLSELNCALGLAQMQRIHSILKKRTQVAQYYTRRLASVAGVCVPYVQEGVKVSWFVYVVRLTKEFTRRHRDAIVNKLKRRGIECASYFPPIHLQPFYRTQFGYKRGDFKVAEYVSQRTIALPFFTHLTERTVDYIVSVFKDTLKEIKKR